MEKGCSSSAISLVPVSRLSLTRSRSMHSSEIESFAFSAVLINVVADFVGRVSTRSFEQTPKFAIAPMPNVPITPALLANSFFFPLEPAFQKLFRNTSSVIPIPSSTIVSLSGSTVMVIDDSRSSLPSCAQRIRTAS